MKKILTIITLLTLIFLAGCSQTTETPNIENNIVSLQNEVLEITTTEEAVNDKITMQEVAKHSTTDSCWIVIDNSVYALDDYYMTSKDNLLLTQACGSDASEFFNHKFLNNKSRAKEILKLESFKIGEI